MLCKKLTALILSFLLATGIAIFSVAAEDSIVPVTVTEETRQISVDAPTVQYEGTVVAISVWKPGYSSKNMAEVFAQTRKLADINAYSGEIIVDANQRIKTAFVLDADAPSGQYTLELHIPGNTAPVCYLFDFRNIARAQATLTIVQSANASAIQTALETGVLDINVESGLLYLTYDFDVKKYISENIASAPPLDEAAFSRMIADEVQKIETVKQLASEQDSRETVKKLIEENYAMLLLNASQDDLWTTYQNLTEIQKEKLYVAITAMLSDCVFPEDVKAVFKLGLKTATTQTPVTPVPPVTSRPSSGGGGGGGGANISVSSDITAVKDPLLEAPKHQFEDIENHWARGVIEYLTTKGVLNGKSETKFAPDDYVTREEFVKLLVTAFNLKASSVEAMAFSDVAETAWHYDYIATAQALDIVSGIAPDAFGVGLNITRQDLATMLHKAVARTGKAFGEEERSFSDADDIQTYAKIAVSKLGGAGIISGYEDNSFQPNQPATRAEAVQMIYNTMDTLKLF